MFKIKRVFRMAIASPKSLFLSLYYFPLRRAIKFPIIVGTKVKIDSLGSRYAVHIPEGSRLKFGVGGSFEWGGYSCWHIGTKGSVTFAGNASFGRGIQFICDGQMSLGSDFCMNANSILNCSNRIEIGNDFLSGWNTEIIDGDGHSIYYNGEINNPPEGIYIGNHVWLAKHVSILKGTIINDGSVCAAGAIITKKFSKANLLLGGNNKILKSNITWER